jgi:peptidoglycan/LPS O-acetylase OafA/YrhL
MAHKDHFIALDGLRGVAALVVIIMHRGRWWYPEGGFLSHGYLAVDFFFLLSGFVIAFAYDGRMATGLSPWRFMSLRLIRLYPLILLGMLLGALWPAIQLMMQARGAPDPADFALNLTRGLLLIPDDHAPGRGDSIFPLNGPTWSLFFELAANLVYALAGRHMTTRVLAVIVALSGAALVWLAFNGGIDVGGRPSTILGGIPRTAFGFFGGALLYRTLTAANARGWRLPTLKAPFLTTAVLLLAILATPSHFAWNPFFNLFAIGVAFPLLVALAAAPGPAKGYGAKLCKLAGDLSYPVYVLHYPIYVLIGGLGLGMAKIPAHAPWIGIATTVIIVAAAWIVLKVYDEPLRRRLMSGVKHRSITATARAQG